VSELGLDITDFVHPFWLDKSPYRDIVSPSPLLSNLTERRQINPMLRCTKRGRPRKQPVRKKGRAEKLASIIVPDSFPDPENPKQCEKCLHIFPLPCKLVQHKKTELYKSGKCYQIHIFVETEGDNNKICQKNELIRAIRLSEMNISSTESNL